MKQKTDDAVLFENADILVNKTVGRGYGLTAKRRFEKGEMLLREAPLAQVPTWLPSDSFEAALSFSDVAELVFDQLPPMAQSKWMALFDHHVGSSIIGTRRKTPGNVLLTNTFTRDGICFLFDLTSRINHSCLPNALHSIVGGEMRVEAAHSIEAGEEILIDYLRGDKRTGTEMALYHRRQILQKHHKFHCVCALCLQQERLPELLREKAAIREEPVKASFPQVDRQL